MRRAAVALGLVAACAHAPAPPPPPLPHLAYAHYLDARIAAHSEDWPTAADELAAAAAAAPDQPMIAVALARAQHAARRDAAAAATLAAARARWPEHPQVWLASADLAARADRIAAIRAYRRAIALAPGLARAYLGLAKLQPAAAATRTLRDLVARVPDSIDGHYRLAQRLAAGQRLDAAIRELRAVLELDPDHIDARLDLARGLRLTGKLDQAIAQTRGAFDRSGQAIDIADELFDLLLEANDRQGALDLLTLLDDDRGAPEALAMVARRQRGLGRIAAARAVIERLGARDAELAQLARAELELATGDPAAAARRALAIPADGRRVLDARRIAATAALAAGAPQQALDALAEVRAAHRDDAELATLAAFALVDLGRRAEAARVLDALPDTAARRYARARVADRAGDAAAALAAVEALLRVEPDHAAALNFAGYLLADAGRRLADAERYLRRARALAPGDPAVLDSWGWLRYRERDLPGAIAALSRAVRLAPLEPEILVHLATVRAAAGAARRARGLLDRAAALHPTPAVRARIDQLRQALAHPR